MSLDARDLLERLPAILRERDEEPTSAGALRAWLEVVAEQADRLERNIEQLLENAFVETCEEWVLPYLGALVGNRPLHEVGHGRRADVARTLAYRRRKGTLSMLEEMARDVTAWPARAVDFFELLGWTQHVNHARPRVHTVDLRDLDALDRIGGPFDALAHTVDVRRIGTTNGWFNLRNVGFFLWRTNAYRLHGRTVASGGAAPRRIGVVPRRVPGTGDAGFRFHPLGLDAPLFHDPIPERAPRRRAEEAHVPAPIRPLAFHRDSSADYGDGRSLAIHRDGLEVPVERIRCMNLRDWARPPAGTVGVDVRLGRFAFAEGEEPSRKDPIRVDVTHGFGADLGGGPYDRRRSLETAREPELRIHVNPQGRIEVDPTDPARHVASSVGQALSRWVTADRPNTTITVHDSETHVLPPKLQLAKGRWLRVEAADGERPILRSRSLARGWSVSTLAGDGPEGANALHLDGVVLVGSIDVRGDLGGLRIAHSTLVPGVSLEPDGTPRHSDVPSVIARGRAGPKTIQTHLQVELERSITGRLEVPAHAERLRITDCIVDGLGGPAISGPSGRPGAPLVVLRSTVLGSTDTRWLDEASDTLFTGVVRSERRQEGCVRFSHVPPGSLTPRRHRCVPDEHYPAADVGPPEFVTARYGHPEYARLRLDGSPAILRGASDGSEMGAYASVKRPQRDANLRTRLDESLPAGLDAGLIDVPVPLPARPEGADA